MCFLLSKDSSEFMHFGVFVDQISCGVFEIERQESLTEFHVIISSMKSHFEESLSTYFIHTICHLLAKTYQLTLRTRPQ